MSRCLTTPLLCLTLLAVAPLSAAETSTELIRDPSFRSGLIVFDPAPGKKVERARFQWIEDAGDPIWGMAQWHSKFSIAGAKPERLGGGAIQFRNETKWIVWAPDDHTSGGLTLGVDSRPEYKGRARPRGEPWPHLLVQQRLSDSPPLTELSSLRFHVEARLEGLERFDPPGYSPRLHTAHYLIHFTVQNLNRASDGFGDFLWFGIPVYDDRHIVPKRHVAGDVASGKLIYTPSGDAFTSGSLHGGEWVSFDADLLPMMREGIEEGWRRDFLKGSREMNDYRLGGMNIGWEVTAIRRASLTIRNLSLRAKGKR